ncbi:hypothetical protein C0Q70_14229 [Pomacea canaliculata]|uniref:Cation efflux protein transmembrane domain-containing protein n=1 Tax=Pomacea canaliculata TaxID=400727 RepID=A0A2T7NZE8_POMCA|nr:hypothetical protein C0Q70_14229 [Pomacea canaliculata]
MASYNTMPDLISSSVNINLEEGTIYPFPSSSKSFLGSLIKEVSGLAQLQEAKKIFIFLSFNILASVILLIWCHSTNSMVVNVVFQHVLKHFIFLYLHHSLLTCLLSIWVRNQHPSPSFSFGYERFEVMAVFATTMLAQLGSFFIIKESIECLIQQPEIHTGRLLVGTVSAFMVHLVLTSCINNRAMNHVVDASTSSWLQEHMTDMSESICSLVPGLSKLLLPRINPMLLMGFGSSLVLIIAYVLIDTQSYHAADTWAAICIAVMMVGTMFPMSVYTGKILLQTTPSHILSQLDKVLREASTLDGVLEFRHEHFWTLSFGVLAGSVQVRVRRDADEQLVLAHVYNRLSNLVRVLTVQIFKDDWTRGSAFSALGSSPFSPPGPHLGGRAQSPTQDFSPTYLPVSSMRPLPVISPMGGNMPAVGLPSRMMPEVTGLARGITLTASARASGASFSSVELS